MVSALLISLREGLEAALIVGIVLGCLGKTGNRRSMVYGWAGVVVAVAASAIVAIAMRFIGAELETPVEQIFEGSTMLLAVAVLTWMLFWMRYQSGSLKADLEHQVQCAVTTKQGWGIFALAFLAVFREGLETALFLAANAFAADGATTLVGALAGLALAAGAGVLIYLYAVRLNLGLFFNVTSFLLIIFAAGMFARGIHEYQEIGLLPFFNGIAWDTKALLDNESLVGDILRSLVGYNDQPSVLEVLTYVGYWVVVLQAVRWWSQRAATRLIQRHA